MNSKPARTGARLRRAIVLACAALVAIPSTVAAGTDGTTSDTGEAPEQPLAGAGADADAVASAADGAELAADPLHVDLGRTLAELDAQVTAERADANAARERLRKAQAALDAARAAAANDEQRVEKLLPAHDPGDPLTALKAPSGATPAPLAFEVAVVSGADELKALNAARDKLAARAAAREEAAAAASVRARQTEAELAELEAAAARKTEFVEQIQKGLADELEDAAQEDDAELVAEIEQRQDVLTTTLDAPKRAAAAKKARAEAAKKAKSAADKKAAAAKRAEAAAAEKDRRAPRPIGAPTRSYPAVSCPGGGSITVDGALAHNLQALVLAAHADGVALCGGGYRRRAEQVQLRIAHCGSSNYAIYQMSPGQCSPPTAVPGTSNHEQGLAIDFRCFGDGIPSHASPCYQWLAGHAAAYGLFNLPSEPWHWSTTGT